MADEFDYSTFATKNSNQGHCAHDCTDSLRRLDDILSATTTSQPVSVAEKEVESTTAPSPPGTDLRMDWADACSLGRLPYLDRYFLLILDKGTEHWATYPTKTRSSPLVLLKQYINTPGRNPRYLRVDNAKDFTSHEMVDYCRVCLFVCLFVGIKPGKLYSASSETMASLCNQWSATTTPCNAA